MDTLYTCWDTITHFKAKSVQLLGLMNSATKLRAYLKKVYSGALQSWRSSGWLLGL